jgi:hypothetical protein
MQRPTEQDGGGRVWVSVENSKNAQEWSHGGGGVSESARMSILTADSDSSGRTTP